MQTEVELLQVAQLGTLQATQAPLLIAKPGLQPVQVVEEEQFAQLAWLQAKHAELLWKNPELQTEHWLAPRQEKQFLTLQTSQLLPAPLLLSENPGAQLPH